MGKRIVVVGLVIIAAAAIATLLLLNRTAPRMANQPSQDTPPPTRTALDCVAAMPASELVSQKLMVAVYSSQLDSELSVVSSTKIGGVIVMDAATADQLSKITQAVSPTPTIAVDQEGGTVQRYTAEGTLAGAADMAAQFSTDEAYSHYLSDDRYLKGLGITTNFAPVVDVLSGTNNPLPGRLYSSDATTVTSYANAAIKAADAAGITPVIKHFPGLGSATGNTDYGPATTDPLSALQTRDLVPYRQLAADKPDVMVSNAIVPGLTDGQPASLSPAAIDLLRGMGYQQAVVYSDSLTAKAVPGTLATAAVQAWQAGVDVALIVQTKEDTPQLAAYIHAITTHANDALAAGTLKKSQLAESVERILHRKHVDPCEI